LAEVKVDSKFELLGDNAPLKVRNIAGDGLGREGEINFRGRKHDTDVIF
jgi:hypothetical protein